MVLLILFAFVAGAATAISPCVLPVLPIVLSAGATGGRRRPLGVVTGLALSFTFATVALVYVIDALGLPSGLPRTLAIVVLIAFGVALLLPPLSARLEGWLSRLTARFAPSSAAAGSGFGGGLLLGFSLGFVYAPCAGPILAGVITVSASQTFSAGRLAVALAYGLGSAVVLYGLALGGRRLTGRLSRRSGQLQIGMGAVMILVAVAMLGGLDTRFETAIASGVPSFLTDPAQALETSSTARHGLQGIASRSGARAAFAPSAALPDAGSTLPNLGTAPEIVGTQRWFNTPGGRSLSLAGLRGRVVLIDFWTYSCINCIRTLPYLRAWDARYRQAGLTIIGVHTPEFPFEKDAGNVAQAVKDDGLHYPVAQDNGQATWNAYGNQYWPAEYLIDAQGHVRAADFGEGDYARKEADIRTLLAARGAHTLATDAPVGGATTAPSNPSTTPESYLGSARAQRFVNSDLGAGLHTYAEQGTPPTDQMAYSGRWQLSAERASAVGGAALTLTFNAQRVYLVLGSSGRPRALRVLLDGRPISAGAAGTDVHGASAMVTGERLYNLVALPSFGRHTLRLQFPPGLDGYAFTFG